MIPQGIILGMMVSMFLNVGRLGVAADARDASLARAGGAGGFGAAAPGERLVFSDRRRLLWAWAEPGWVGLAAQGAGAVELMWDYGSRGGWAGLLGGYAADAAAGGWW